MLDFKKFSGKVGDIKKDYGVNINSVITGPNLITIEIPTSPGKNASAPNLTITGCICIVITRPIINPVTLTIGSVLIPSSSICLRI